MEDFTASVMDLLSGTCRVEDTPPFDPARAVVLFPSEDAVEVQQLEAGSIDRVFIIDSRWSVHTRQAQWQSMNLSTEPVNSTVSCCHQGYEALDQD
jgi:hypothetical protein